MASRQTSFYTAESIQGTGDECSSTNEGRYVNIQEQYLVHPFHLIATGGLVEKGDPCVVSSLVGIAMKTALADTDFITLDTEGIWWLNVVSSVAAIVIGQRLYIDATSGVVSDDTTDVPFGYALAAVDNGETTLIPVKVHACVVPALPN